MFLLRSVLPHPACNLLDRFPTAVPLALEQLDGVALPRLTAAANPVAPQRVDGAGRELFKLNRPPQCSEAVSMAGKHKGDRLGGYAEVLANLAEGVAESPKNGDLAHANRDSVKVDGWNRSGRNVRS